MSTPQSYDTAKISVSPQTLSDVAGQLNGLIQDLAGRLDDIAATLSGLQLSWVGSSADLAGQFSARWQEAATSLFGTKQDPGEGALTRLASGIQSAAQNYDAVEQWAVSAYGKLAAALAGGSSSGPPQSVTNSGGQVVTAITETF